MTLGKRWAAVIALCLAAQAYPATTGRTSPHAPGTALRNNPAASLSQRPVVFEPNVGQFERGVRYRASGGGMSLSLGDASAVLSLDTEPGSQRPIRITPVNASRRARPRALDRLPGVVNHFESTAPSAWHAGVPTYGRVRYPAVYPGIDLVYHGSPDQLEYDFLVNRGADPSRIAVRFDGADRVELDATGDLLIHAGDTVVRQRAPYAFQEHGRERRRVDARYRLTKDGEVAFTIGSYDRRLPLVIDPILLYSSYLHSQTSRVAIDAAGYLVVVTERFVSGPDAKGIKVERLTPDGQTSIYTTLIGASYMPIAGVAATPNGEAVVAGSTYASDFPLVNPSQGYPGDASSSNAFVFKLGPGGDFVFSTYLGGTSSDTAYGLSITNSGTIVVAGWTSSEDFPGVDGLRSGYTAGFVTLFSAGGARLHGALLPSSVTAVDVDPLGAVYVAGTTTRRDWPTTPGAFQTDPYVSLCGDYSFGPCREGVLAKLSADLGSLVYATYIHPTIPLTYYGEVVIQALEVDAAGAAYILGTSALGSFTATPGTLLEQCPPYYCTFLAKLNPAGSGRVYSTFLPDYANTLQVDSRGNAYLSGARGPTTPSALQPAQADAYLFVTADGGTTWRPAPAPQPTYDVDLAHGAGPILYTATSQNTLYRSADLGKHWTQLEGQLFGNLFTAPSNPNVLYEVAGQRGRRSSDGGTTWAPVALPIDIWSFAVDPVDAQTLYAGGRADLFKSVNGGSTWSSISGGINFGVAVRAIAAAPSNHDVLFAQVSTPYPFSVQVELYRSVNGGGSWTLMSSWPSLSFGNLAIDPLDATRLYVCADGKPWRSTNSGASWTLFADTSCRAIAVARTPDLTVFVGTEGGLARVVDTGGTLSAPLSVSLGNSSVYQILVDPVDPSVIAASTFSSDDGFVSVLDPTGSTLRYGSYFGGSDSDYIGSMALGPGGTLAISGSTRSPDLPRLNPRNPERGALYFDSFVALMRIPLPAVVIDAPAAGSIGQVFNISGWAIDTGAPAGGGIDAVHVYAFPQSGAAPVFVGVASYGGARPDVGSAFGAQFTNSGFTLTGARLPEGPYTLAAFARSTVSETFDAATRSVQVVSGGRMNIDAPTPDASVYQPFTITGWALDSSAPSGTGVDTVHVWAYPDGGAPRFVGAAAYGGNRPDVGTAFGSRFAASGFTLQASGLPTGSYTLAVFARSLVSGAFDLVRTVRVTLPDGGAAAIDTPVAGGIVSTPFVVSGWALDRQGEGSGVDAIHIWAYPVAGGAPTFLGVTTGVSRPDVATAFGDARFAPSGYSLTVNTLPPGTYTVVVYARSVATGAFSVVRSVQVTVN